MGQPETYMLGSKTKWSCTWTKETFHNSCSPLLNKFCHHLNLDSMAYSPPVLWDQLTEDDPTFQCRCVTVLSPLVPSCVTLLCLQPWCSGHITQPSMSTILIVHANLFLCGIDDDTDHAMWSCPVLTTESLNSSYNLPLTEN